MVRLVGKKTVIMPLCNFYAIHGSSYCLKTLDVEMWSVSWPMSNPRSFSRYH